MKKLAVVALMGILAGLIYLAVKHKPSPVSAPKIKSAQVIEASRDFATNSYKPNRSLTAHRAVNRPVKNAKDGQPPTSAEASIS